MKRYRMFVLFLLAPFVAGCIEQGDVPPKDESGHVETPPPVGLEANPGRPQSERPTEP